MAEPIHFPESNTTWHGPTGMPDVGDLPSYREKDETISCWQLTDDEKAEVLKTGVVWLHIWGIHPPVSIQGLGPFIYKEDE